MTSRLLLGTGALILALAGCSGSSDGELHPDDAALLEQPADAAGAAVPDSEAAVDGQQSAPAAPQVAGADPVALADNAVAVGSTLTEEGRVADAMPAYDAAGPVHASVPVEGYPPGTDVTMYWFGGGGSVKIETKKIPAGARFVGFTLTREEGLVVGSFTAQADVGEVPVGMADFIVR